MRLLYVWIGKYKSLSNVGINFTNEHKFSYNFESGIITYERNESILNNFYCDKTSPDSFIDIHAIVGDNGVGKSTIIEAIINLAINENDSSTSGIVAFMNNEGMILVFNKYFPKSCNKNVFIKYDKKYESKFKLNSYGYRKFYSDSYIHYQLFL